MDRRLRLILKVKLVCIQERAEQDEYIHVDLHLWTSNAKVKITSW